MLHYERTKAVVKERASSRPSELVRAYRAAWKSRNKGLIAANAAARKRHIRAATPKWLTKDQKERIKAFYIEADRLKRETGIDYEVDHIVPIRGGVVSGLHVPWNLRVITAEENQAKNCKLIEDLTI